MNEYFDENEFDTTLDALIEYVYSLPKPKLKIINPERYRLMLQCAAELAALLRETTETAEVNIDINDFFSTGAVSVVLNSLTVYDPAAFSQLISHAENFEIYPLTNGKIRLAISFHSVLETIV